MEYWKLIGIAIIVVGFTLKFDVLAVVLTAGIVTGFVAGINFYDILTILGQSFVNNRLMSIFLIIFPVIAIIERYGLKERAGQLIGRNQHHHVSVATIHTTHALQHDIIGVHHRNIKTKELIHRIVGNGG